MKKYILLGDCFNSRSVGCLFEEKDFNKMTHLIGVHNAYRACGSFEFNFKGELSVSDATKEIMAKAQEAMRQEFSKTAEGTGLDFPMLGYLAVEYTIHEVADERWQIRNAYNSYNPVYDDAMKYYFQDKIDEALEIEDEDDEDLLTVDTKAPAKSVSDGG